MEVLIVEDERKFASFVSKGLQEAGFVVDVLYNGDDAAAVLFTVPYDAVILDIMLPGRDGLSLLKELPQRGSAVPVILLTARGGLEEKLEGVDARIRSFAPRLPGRPVGRGAPHRMQ